VDDDGFYVSTADGTLVKVTRRTGIELWKQDVLGHRRLSAPAVLGEYVAVGDLDGYLHFFNRSTGEPAARVHALGARVAAPPIASGDLLVAADVEGRIVALRATAIAAAGDKAAKP
jgi:outer membrane protein assembly factor BamB